MTQTVDFSHARFMHLNWKFKIRNYLDGKETLSEEQAVSHKHCDLGKWYYEEGKSKYGQMTCMKNFEEEHEKLHNIVKSIQQLRSKGKADEAENLYNHLVTSSDNIVELLNEAEYIINHQTPTKL